MWLYFQRFLQRYRWFTHFCKLFFVKAIPYQSSLTADMVLLMWKEGRGGSEWLGNNEKRWDLCVGAGFCWRPAASHQRCVVFFLSHQGCKAGVLRPSTGRQMVPFGKGPQHSDLCLWGSTGAAKNKHDLRLLGTYRSLNQWSLYRRCEWYLELGY